MNYMPFFKTDSCRVRTDMLLKICNAAWHQEKLRTYWCRSLINPVHRKGCKLTPVKLRSKTVARHKCGLLKESGQQDLMLLLSMQVVAMSVSRNILKVGVNRMHSGVSILQQSHNIEMKTVLRHELTYPCANIT